MKTVNKAVERARNRYAQNKGKGINKKICPLMSSPEKKVECTEECQLYLTNKKEGYECPLKELNAISYALRK